MKIEKICSFDNVIENCLALNIDKQFIMILQILFEQNVW